MAQRSRIANKRIGCLYMVIALLVMSMHCQKCIQFDDYMVEYSLNEEKGSEKYNAYRANYEANCLWVAQQNAINDFKMSSKGQYMELTNEQLIKKLGVTPLRFSSDPSVKLEDVAIKPEDIRVSAVTVPSSYNMVDLGWISSIKNQGSCGCCWSFASVAMYEGILKRHNSAWDYGLSQQGSLQCTSFYAPNKRESDCSGGYFRDALIYLQKVGCVQRKNYPYVSGDWGPIKGHATTSGICAQTSRIMLGTGVTKVYGPLSIEQVKYLLFTEGPMMVGFYANQAFMRYSSGVFTGCPADAQNFINHAVTLVGYNDQGRYWLVKNQYATNWGENGYIRVSYDRDCGITSLLGNLKFTSYNSFPEISLNKDSPLLFQNGSFGTHFVVSMFMLLLLLSLLY